MRVIQGQEQLQYSQTNGSLIKKSGGGKKVVVESDSGEDEEIEETQTIIKKTIIRKKGKKTYVRILERKVYRENALENFVIVSTAVEVERWHI
jgi:L-fucose mutarotase/ribose pyranase (RbsD/FucU family)